MSTLLVIPIINVRFFNKKNYTFKITHIPTFFIFYICCLWSFVRNNNLKLTKQRFVTHLHTFYQENVGNIHTDGILPVLH